MSQPPSVDGSRPRRRFPTILAWITTAAAVLFIVTGASTDGVPGLLVAIGVIGLITAIYTLVTGRRSWARLASRRIAAGAMAFALLATMVGGSLAGAARAELSDAVSRPALATAPESATPTPPPSLTPTPSPAPSVAFTDEAPADPPTVTAPDSQAVADTPATTGTALAVLATLPVKGKSPKTGYDRTGDFGTAWLDVDHNGCDTRNDIVARDLHDIVRSGPCTVLTGTFTEPYTGATMHFVRGQDTSALVQIDHVVALANAWQTGAQKLTQAQRISLANDPLNLLAADGRANAQKSDGDAATWLPATKSFRCAYVARQISVKATYRLWVAPAERDAMARVLSSCPDQPALTSTFAPVPASAPVAPPAPAPVVEEPAPAPAPEAPAPSSIYYQNCTAVRAAGAAPIRQGDPGYSRTLDRDGDGIGCE